MTSYILNEYKKSKKSKKSKNRKNTRKFGNSGGDGSGSGSEYSKSLIIFSIFTLSVAFIWFIIYILQDNYMFLVKNLKENLNYKNILKNINIIENQDGFKSFLIKPDKITRNSNLWIFFPGNSSLASSNLSNALIVKNCKNNKKDFFLLFEYPYIGLNYKKKISSSEEINDLINDFVYNIKKEYKIKKINVFGISLGTATALKFTKHRNDINNLFLLSPFTTYSSIFKKIIKFPFPTFFIKKKWNNVDNIKKSYPNKLFIFHCKKDKIVPFSQSEYLFEISSHIKTKIFIPIDSCINCKNYHSIDKYVLENYISYFND